MSRDAASNPADTGPEPGSSSSSSSSTTVVVTFRVLLFLQGRGGAKFDGVGVWDVRACSKCEGSRLSVGSV